MTCDMEYKILFTHDWWPAFFRWVKCPMGRASSRQMPHYVELNSGQMPGGCPGGGGWSRLELTDTLLSWVQGSNLPHIKCTAPSLASPKMHWASQQTNNIFVVPFQVLKKHHLLNLFLTGEGQVRLSSSSSSSLIFNSWLQNIRHYKYE